MAGDRAHKGPRVFLNCLRQEIGGVEGEGDNYLSPSFL